jgi:hypothetical protein
MNGEIRIGGAAVDEAKFLPRFYDGCVSVDDVGCTSTLGYSGDVVGVEGLEIVSSSRPIVAFENGKAGHVLGIFEPENSGLS